MFDISGFLNKTNQATGYLSGLAGVFGGKQATATDLVADAAKKGSINGSGPVDPAAAARVAKTQDGLFGTATGGMSMPLMIIIGGIVLVLGVLILRRR